MAEKIRNLAARTLSAFALHWKPAEHSSRPVLSPVVPVQEVITIGGRLVWRICAGVHCVEAFSGADAWHKMRRLCREHGITLATTGVTEPEVGPPPLPDPGV
jgi:hypothetical protein